MIKKRIDDLEEDDVMNHTLNIMLVKGWIIGHTTDDVYEFYEYFINNPNHLSKYQLTKTLIKYYGLKLVRKRINGKIKRIYKTI